MTQTRKRWEPWEIEEALKHQYYDETSTVFQKSRTYQGFRQQREEFGKKGYPTRSKNPAPENLVAQPGGFSTDKKSGEFNWRDAASLLKNMQEVKKSASWSQDQSRIYFDVPEPILILPVSDFHLGAWSTDYDTLARITEEIIETPNLYICILSDMEHMAIKMRNILEIMDNALPPELQESFIESWLDDVADKCIFGTWDNHSVMREEAVTGRSAYKKLLSRRMVYFNGIGHVDVTVGNQTYAIAASHFFRGRSELNPLHSQMKYMRFQSQSAPREICLAGDSHVPAMAKYIDGDKVRLALNAGSIQTNSGYAKRFFSLKTHAVYPCFTLHPDEHLFSPYWSVNEYIANKRA